MRLMASRFLQISILTFAFLHGANAQSVNAPTFSEGEKWEYQTTDLWSKKIISHLTVTNIGVSGDYLRRFFEQSNTGHNGEFVKPESWEATVRADLNGTGIYRGERFERIWYKWPVEPGMSWAFQTKAEAAPIPPSTAARIMTTSVNAEVKNWETVEVPAGKYKALKIVYKSSWVAENPSGTGSSVSTSWYSPEIKGSVQDMTETFSAEGMPQARTVRQLVFYKPNDK
jgi:hypothetical protein